MGHSWVQRTLAAVGAAAQEDSHRQLRMWAAIWSCARGQQQGTMHACKNRELRKWVTAGAVHTWTAVGFYACGQQEPGMRDTALHLPLARPQQAPALRPGRTDGAPTALPTPIP